MEVSRERRISIWLVYMSGFIATFIRRTKIPVLWPYLESMGGTLNELAIAKASYGVMFFLSSLPFNIAADRVSFKVVFVILGGVFQMAGALLYVAAYDARLPWFLILARFLNGANFLVVARTYVLSVLSPAQQKGVQTRLSIAVALGYLLGPMTTWVFHYVNYSYGYIAFNALTVPGYASILLLFVFVLFVVLFFESPPQKTDSAAPRSMALPLLSAAASSPRAGGSDGGSGGPAGRSRRKAAKVQRIGAGADVSRAESPAARLATEKNFTRAVLVLYLNLFVQWFVVTGMESWSVPYAVDTFGWSDLETSLLYMGIGAANLCLLAWYQNFSERVGVVPIFHAGVILVALGCMTLFQFSSKDAIGDGLSVGSTLQLVQFCVGTMVVLSVGSPLWYTPNLLIFGALMQAHPSKAFYNGLVMMITALGMTVGPLCYVLLLESDLWNVVVGAIAAVLLLTVVLNVRYHGTFVAALRKKR